MHDSLNHRELANENKQIQRQKHWFQCHAW